MESSETKIRAIALGKQLVEELRRGPDVDTLSRWMAHYIAQQIATAEIATGNNKAAAEDECVRSILALWEHRAAFPHDRRPFESFEPILRALDGSIPSNRDHTTTSSHAPIRTKQANQPQLGISLISSSQRMRPRAF
jgi:hypothetical protein